MLKKVLNPNLGWLTPSGTFWGGGGGSKITPPYMKLVRIMLETWNFVRKYPCISSFRKCTF